MKVLSFFIFLSITQSGLGQSLTVTGEMKRAYAADISDYQIKIELHVDARLVASDHCKRLASGKDWTIYFMEETLEFKTGFIDGGDTCIRVKGCNNKKKLKAGSAKIRAICSVKY